MGNSNDSKILLNDKNYRKLQNDDKSIMICRIFNYCNLDNNQDVIITINMKTTKINKNKQKSIKDNISEKYSVNNKNTQKNTIYIKANEYRSIPICYYYDDWNGTIKLNDTIIVKKLKFNKKIRYDVIDISKCNKNFYDNNYQIYKNMKSSTLNNCINVLFEYNNIQNETLYFVLNIKNPYYGKQSNIYEIKPLKYFKKTFCFCNNYLNTNNPDLNINDNVLNTNERDLNINKPDLNINEKNINWIVSNSNFTEIYYCDLNFILNKNIFNIDVKIEDYPYKKSFTKDY
jgi:hypothetical protein